MVFDPDTADRLSKISDVVSRLPDLSHLSSLPDLSHLSRGLEPPELKLPIVPPNMVPVESEEDKVAEELARCVELSGRVNALLETIEDHNATMTFLRRVAGFLFVLFIFGVVAPLLMLPLAGDATATHFLPSDDPRLNPWSLRPIFLVGVVGLVSAGLWWVLREAREGLFQESDLLDLTPHKSVQAYSRHFHALVENEAFVERHRDSYGTLIDELPDEES